MPIETAKFRAKFTNQEQAHYALLAVSDVLVTLVGKSPLTAWYGVGANIHVGLQWQPMGSSTDVVGWLIHDSIAQRIIVPGHSDFLIKLPDDQFAVMFGHESDINLDGNDGELIQGFLKSTAMRVLPWQPCDEVNAETARKTEN